MIDKKFIIAAVIILLAVVLYMCFTKTEAFQDKGPLKDIRVIEVEDLKASDYIIYKWGGPYIQVDKIYYYNAYNSIVFMGNTKCSKTQTVFVKIMKGDYANSATYIYNGLWTGSRLPDPGQLTTSFSFAVTKKNCIDSFAKIDAITDREKLENMAKFYLMGFIPDGECSVTGGLPVTIPVRKIYVVKDDENKVHYVAFVGTYTAKNKEGDRKVYARVVKRDIPSGNQSVWQYVFDQDAVLGWENIETIDYRGLLQKSQENMFVTKLACL